MVALASTAAAQQTFADLQGKWLSARPAERASMRPALEDLLDRVTRSDDTVEPLVRAYLAIAWLDAGVPTAAEAVSRPLIDGPPGVAQDLAILVHGAAARRAGRAADAVAALRMIIGKLIDPFARPLLDEEFVEALIDEHRYEDAMIYADVWLREPVADHHALHVKVVQTLRRIPSADIDAYVGAGTQGEVDGGPSNELLGILSHELRDESLQPVPEMDASVGATAEPTILRRRARDAAAIAFIVPSSSTELGARATAVVRAAIEVAAPSLSSERSGDTTSAASAFDAAIDATSAIARGKGDAAFEGGAPGAGAPEPSSRLRLSVYDSAGTAAGAAAAVDRAVADGASMVVGGVSDAEAAAIDARAAECDVAAILFREPPKMHATSVAIGPTLADETTRAMEIATRTTTVDRIAVVSDASASGDPLHVSCASEPQHAGDLAFPVDAWRSLHVAVVVVIGDDRCGRRVMTEIGAASSTAFRPHLVLSSTAIALLFEPFKVERATSVAGLLPAGDDAPSELRDLWLTQDRPVGWWSALGHDAATLGAGALLGVEATTTDATATQRIVQRLRTVNATLWSTEATSFGGKSDLPRTFRVVTVAAGDALHPSWLSRPAHSTYK